MVCETLVKTMIAVTQSLFNQILSWYFSYAESYSSSDPDFQESILLKKKHSLRVAALSGVIAKELGLSNEDIVLAKIIGLLNDIARFEQYQRFQTFNDKISFDHGEFGSKLLLQMDCLEGFDHNLREIISCAVFHHNKINVPGTLSEREMLYTRIVRDADKLDIIYLTCSYLKKGCRFPSVFPASNGKLSPKIVQALARRQLIDYSMVQSLSDFHLLKIAWIYDLNFTPSLAIIHKRRHINTLKDALPASIELEEQFVQLDRYIREQLK
jgi:5'-deoxynucleotidase YfbR-like HD superfamily hydrolase